jgi:hypothetical protein
MLCSIEWQYKLGTGKKKEGIQDGLRLRYYPILSGVVEKAHKSPKPRLESTPFEEEAEALNTRR